jgi:hypothetical protein
MSLRAVPFRSLLVAVGLGLVATALPGAAAPAPQIMDAKGDAADGNAGHDIESVLFTKTAKGFTVTMTLAGPQSTRHGVNYVVSAETANCGRFTINWTPVMALPPSYRDQIGMECGEPGATGDPYTIINVAPTVAGNTLTWSFSKKQFPDELAKGGTFSDLAAGVDPNDPVFGIIGPKSLGAPLRLDDAVGKGSFKF